MAVFNSTEQMYEVLGGLWQQLLDDPENGPKFKEAQLKVKYTLSGPSGVIWVTSNGVLTGEQDLKPDVEMTLSADTAHKFWLQQITLPAALAKKLITSKGSMAKVMKLLPMLKPLHDLYPQICARHNLPM